MMITTLETRKVLFTCNVNEKNEEVVRVKIALPGHFLNPPKFLQFRGKLYQSKGSGLSCNFYHEAKERFAVVECDTDYTRSEFSKL
jgi:hypothetical protein